MNKFFMQHKNKFKKLFYIFPIFVICFSLVFSVSAQSVRPLYFNYAQPSSDVNKSGYIEVVTQSESGSIIPFVFSWNLFSEDNNPIAVVVSSTLHSINIRAVSNSSFVFQFACISNEEFYNWNKLSDATLALEDGSIFSCDVTLTDIDGDIRYWFNQYTIFSINCYGNSSPGSAGANSSIFNEPNSFCFIYGNDTQVNNTLNAILSVLQSQNNSDVTSAIQGGTNEIKQNQDSNTQEQINNDNANTEIHINNDNQISQDIQDNANANTDKIINGGTDYGTVDKSQSNDYIAKEEALNIATVQSQENAVSLFSNFGSFFNNSKLTKGLTGATRIMSDFLQINWLSDMSNFALALGAFAFVIGAGVLVGGIHRNKVSAERRKVN